MARRRKPILRFFKRKVMDEQTVDQGPIDPQVIEDTPVSEQVDIPEEVVETPTETNETPQDVVSAIEEQESVQDENIEMVEKKTENSEPTPTEDRSAFNCPACSGEGLVDGQRCTTCNGTGKV